MTRKTCKKEGCNSFVWSKGLCKYHHSIENPPKKIVKRFNEKKKEGKEEVILAMYEWWKKQDNKCMACGINLPKEFKTWMVDHLLEKSKHPKLALDERNFFLVCFDDHQKKTIGYPHPIHKEAIERAKELFNNALTLEHLN